MRKMLNTLFVFNPETYLSLDNEAVLVQKGTENLMRVPLLALESILYFGYKGTSPALLGYCGEHGIRFSFLTPNGKFLASVCGENKGNILLRKEQYRRSDDDEKSLIIARNFILGKVYNARWILERGLRDHGMRIDQDKVKQVSLSLKDSLLTIRDADSLESLRGMEGKAAEAYFSALDELILQEKDFFYFHERSRRPPLDRFNALLSFAYVLLANDCAAALESVGLDPYCGFLHTDRPGRNSLALDLMEELRSVLAERFVLSQINGGMIKPNDFLIKENGSVFIKEEARKTFLKNWQTRKQEQLRHPFLNEKMEWGLVPYAQALLLARFLRGDLDEYPPFMWK